MQVVTRCLEKDPSHRFPNVAMLADGARAILRERWRGTTDRTWRSLVATGDQIDLPSGLHEQPNVADSPLAAGTLATFGGTKSGKPSPKAQKRTFAGGLIAGLVVAAGLGGAAFFMAPPRAPAASPRAEVVTIIPSAKPLPVATAPWTAAPVEPASAAPVPVKPSAPSLVSKPKTAPIASDPRAQRSKRGERNPDCARLCTDRRTTERRTDPALTADRLCCLACAS